MLSKSSKYAIKAVIYLARHSDETHKILVRDMYEEVKVSESYLAKLLQVLSRHGLISSIKGRGGGFYLTEANRQHSLLEIVRTIDGPDAVEACVLGIHACNETHPCGVHGLLGPAKFAFTEALRRTKLADLTADPTKTDFTFPE